MYVFESKWAILTGQHSKIYHDPIFNSSAASADAHTSPQQALVISILSRVKIVADVS